MLAVVFAYSAPLSSCASLFLLSCFIFASLPLFLSSSRPLFLSSSLPLLPLLLSPSPPLLLSSSLPLFLSMIDGESVPNWKRWEGGMNVADKRCLVTWWVGAAYDKFRTAKYEKARLAAWRTGGSLSGVEPSSSIDIRGLGRLFTEDASVVIDDAYKKYHFTGCPDFAYNGGEQPEVQADSSDDSSESESDSDSGSGSSD